MSGHPRKTKEPGAIAPKTFFCACHHASVARSLVYGATLESGRAGGVFSRKTSRPSPAYPPEEVYLHQYRDQEEARASIQRFIEEIYNRKRLHSALGYLAPDAFEQRNPSDPGTDGGPTQ